MTPESIQLIRSNLGAFLLAENPEYTYVPFQQEYMVPALHKVGTHEIEALAILMPPRHGKSDLASIHFTAWLFGRFPERKNMLLSYSDKFAKRFGHKIVNLLRSDVHQEAFPECRLTASAHSGSYFTTTKGGEFFSAGFGGGITGAGVTGVGIIDDPIKNMEEARSKLMMDCRL